MNIPNHRDTAVRVFVDRYVLSHLTDTDGAPLIDTDGARLLALPTNRVPIEITDRVRSGRVSLGDVSAIGSSHAGVDATVAVLNLTLDHGEPSLAPGASSVLNEPDELLRPYRPIRVVGYDGGDPVTLFAGYLGDEIRSSASAGRASITLTARDLAKPLQDLFISEFPVLAADATPETPVPLVDVLTQLLALAPRHLRPPLVVASDIFFSVSEPYRPQNLSLWDAMQQLVLQGGLYLGVVGEELVLLDPPRDKITPDVTLDTDDAFTDDLGISDTDVRNAVRVVYTDAETLERRVVEARDEWSIENITGGIEKLSVIELDATSQIDTEEEAEALASRFIADMSREFASTQLNLPFLPGLWLFDVIEMTHEKFTALPRTFAVHSIQHTFDQTRRRTVVAGVGQVVGKRRAWLHLEPRPGSPNDPRGPHQSVLPPPIIVVEPASPGFTVTIEPNKGVDAVRSEIHWSLVNGFIPGPSTLKAEGNQERWTFNNTDAGAVDFVQPGLVHYVRVRSIDSQGNPGRFTAQRAVTPGGVEGAWIEIDNDTRFSGTVEITNAERTTGALSVKTSAGVEVARLGNISGKPGVPVGTQFGLWGALGAGAYIQGVPQVLLVERQIFDVSTSHPALAAGESFAYSALTGPEVVLDLPPVPEGMRMRAMPVVQSYWHLRTGVSSADRYKLVTAAWGGFVELRRKDTGTWEVAPWLLPPGQVFDRARFSASGVTTAVTAIPAATLQASIQLHILILLVPEEASGA